MFVHPGYDNEPARVLYRHCNCWCVLWQVIPVELLSNIPALVQLKTDHNKLVAVPIQSNHIADIKNSGNNTLQCTVVVCVYSALVYTCCKCMPKSLFQRLVSQAQRMDQGSRAATAMAPTLLLTITHCMCIITEHMGVVLFKKYT